MASEHTEQSGTDEARLHRDRAQDATIGSSEEPRILPRPSATPRLSPALSATLNAALDRLLEVLGVDGGAVRLLEEEGLHAQPSADAVAEETRELVLVAHRGVPPQLAQDAHHRKVGEGLSGLALQQEAPIVVEHLSQHPTLADSRLRQEGFESCMVVPLRLHGQLIGTVSLFARSARGFDTYERSFFYQVGVSLENALLYEEAARREQEAAFLDHATQLFNSTLELDVILQQVTRLATEVLGDSCSIALVEPGNAYLVPGASYHPDPQEQELRLRAQRESPIRIGDAQSAMGLAASLMGLAAADGRPYLVKDARQDRRLRQGGGFKIYSLIVVPIIVKGKILGVLGTSIAHPGRQFTQADLRLAMALADRAALAIENSRLYTQERQLRQELEDLNQQVQEANRLKTEFVTVVTHELRSPLTAIVGYVDLLLEAEGREAAATREAYLQIVKRNTDRLQELINDLLDIARLEAGKLELQRSPLDLEGLIQEVSGALRPQIEAKDQQLRLDLGASLPVVTGDPERFTQILLNLVSNAHKYTPQGGSITIATRAERAGVCIAVQDTGIGLSSEEQQQLFTKFFRAQHPLVREAGGTGLGLAIARALVELHGGTLTVVSAPDQGSSFNVTLPAAHELTA
jgi:signal transduction histidine kinase